MQYSTIVKKKPKHFGISKKFLLQVRDDVIQLKKLRGNRIDYCIHVNCNTFIGIEQIDGKDYIAIRTEDKLYHLLTKTDLIQCLIGLRSTKFAFSRITLNDFTTLATLGHGSFGQVNLVLHNHSKKLYALKILNKNQLYESKNIATVLSERKILENIYDKNPFIVKMLFAFQNVTHFYFGLEYLPGGDLRHLLTRKQTINIHDLRIYVAEIATCLHFLHESDIIYRDLKPENILVDSDGHLKLTDFGLAKDISQFKKTSSFCGTQYYFSPEIIQHKQYTYSSDWYQLGVVMFELFYGKVPFFDENRLKLLNMIVSEEPSFPDDSNHELNDLIRKLMNKNPEERLDFDSLRNHPFFKGFSFEEVEKKEYQPSFVPELKHVSDTQYFLLNSERDSPNENQLCVDDLNAFGDFPYVSPEFESFI